MDNIYLLKIGDTPSYLIGLKNKTVYSLSVKYEIIANHRHSYLEESFEYCQLEDGEEIFDALFIKGLGLMNLYRLKEISELVKMNLTPGNYNPRIYRPLIKSEKKIIPTIDDRINDLRIEIGQYQDYIPYNEKSMISSLNNLSILKDMLISLFKNIYPENNNLNTYGQNTKNLLILSCIEVENQLKGIFIANENTSKSIYTTKEYVKLNKFLHLENYTIKLSLFPQLAEIIPFKNWDENNPTKSLTWYDSYNAIKHNSEVEFHKASLINTINAVCAVAILLKAQYGDKILLWKELIGDFFEIKNNTIWGYDEKIIPPFKNDRWHMIKLNL